MGGTIQSKTACPDAKPAGSAGDDLANARNDSTNGIAGVTDALATNAGGQASATVRTPTPQKMDPTSRLVLPPAAPIPLPQSGQLLPEPLTNPPKAQPTPITPAAPTPTTSTAAAATVPQASAAVATPAISTTATAIPSPAIPAAPDSKTLPAKPAPLPQLAPANGIHAQVAAEEKPGTSS